MFSSSSDSVVSLLYLLPECKLILLCTHLTQRNLAILGQRKTVSFIFQISLLINGISKFLETLHVHAFVNQNRGLFADRDKIKTENGYSVWHKLFSWVRKQRPRGCTKHYQAFLDRRRVEFLFPFLWIFTCGLSIFLFIYKDLCWRIKNHCCLTI